MKIFLKEFHGKSWIKFSKHLFYIKGQIENYHTHVSFGVFESFSNSPVLPSIGGDMVAGKETGRKTRGGGNSSGGNDKKHWDQIDFWSKMSKKSIFGEKFLFWSKKSIFGQKCRKSRFLVKNVDFW